MPITTNVVRSNPTHGEVYLIEHYVIKFFSDIREVGCFFPGTPISSTNRNDRNNKMEILLNVALNMITLTINIEHRYVQYNAAYLFGSSL